MRIGRGKRKAYKPGMHAPEKSDIGIVPRKEPNKVRKLTAEALEGRPVANGKTVEDDCDLYAEAGGNIEWTRQDT
jgi:hypothetical protein